MVKSSHDGENYGHQKSPRPGNTPSAKGSGAGSRGARNRQASARMRQSLGLTALRDNYSQLLHEFAEWSTASPANKQSRVSGSCSDSAITPEAPVPHISSKAKHKQSRQLSQSKTSDAQADGQHKSAEGASTQGEALQQDGASIGPSAQVAVGAFDHLVTPVRVPLSQHANLRSPRSARGATTKRRSKRHEPKTPSSTGNTSRPRRKSQPRPAWRSSIDLSGIQQQQQPSDTALQENSGLQAQADTTEQPSAETGVTAPGAQHLVHVAVDEPRRTQQQRSTPFQEVHEPSGPVSAEEPLQQAAQVPIESSHAVADNNQPTHQKCQQQQQQQQEQLGHMETAQHGQHKQDVQPAAQAAAQQQPGSSVHLQQLLQQQSTVESVFSAVKRVIMGRKSKSQITAEPVSPRSAAAAAPRSHDGSMLSSPQPPATHAAMIQQGHTQRHGTSNAAVAAVSSRQEQSQQPGPRRRSRVSDSSAAVQQQAAGTGGHAGKVPLLPLQQVQPAADPATTTSQAAAGSHSSAASAAPTSAAQTGSIRNDKQRSMASGGAAAARVDNVEVPELLPGGVTYRRHSAADADQGNSDVAGPTSVRQVGVTVAPGLGNASRISGNGTSSSTVDTRESLQHIKQLQALRRRSVGPQVSDSAPVADGLLPASTAALPLGPADDGHVQGHQQPHHRRTGSYGSSASSTSGGGLQPLAQRSYSIGASRGSADVSANSNSSNSGAPDSRPGWPASRRGSSTQLPPLDESAVLVMPAVAAAAGAPATVAPMQLPRIIPPGSRRGSRTDEATSTNSSTQQQATERQWSAAADGPLDPGLSSVNLVYEDSFLGPGLNHELSSYGVCGDNPAGAVQLSRGAIPQKLARLKCRVSSRQITTDEDGQPSGPAPAVVDAAADGLPPWSGAVAVASDPGSSAASAVSDSAVVMQHRAAHHGHSRSAGDHVGHQEQALSDRHPQAPLRGQSEHRLPVEQHHHHSSGAAARPRARWHIPDAAVAPEPPTPPPAAPQQHFPQQPLPMPPDYYHVQQQLMPQGVQQAPPPPSEHQQHRWPPLQPTEPWQQHNHHHQLQQQGVYHGPQHPLPTRSASCKQPPHFGEQQHVQVHDHYTQHGRMGQSHSFTHSGQQQHWQRQQQWPQHPGQMVGWGQPLLPDQHQLWPPQQQQWGQPATGLAWQQQQQQQYQPPLQLPPPGGSILPGALPPLNFVPPHPSLEQYRLPNIDGRRQTMEPLPAYLPQPPGFSGTAASSRPPAAMAGANSNAAAATAAALTALSATAASMAGPGGYIAPPAGSLSRFTDPWAERQQQGQQAAEIYQAQQPPHQQSMHHDQQQQQHSVASAAAIARQRQEAQKAAFEGMSLEDVLKTAKKAKPPAFGAKARHSAPDTETSGEHEAHF